MKQFLHVRVQRVLHEQYVFLTAKHMAKLLLTIVSLLYQTSSIATTPLPPITENNVQIEVSGKISDVNGVVPGVNVLIKGTTRGATSDGDGNYNITVDNANQTLVFSFIGYQTQEIVVGNRTTINVTMVEDAQSLDEVVVVGYTTKKKGEITGSISTLNSEEISNTANRDLAKSLSGKVSGLVVSDRGGYPGSTGDVSILIRGKSTLNNNSPLILIDGIPSANFSFLSPQDIESLSVLKDGAAAIYGARAANGVILITTKRGKSGKPKFNLSSTVTRSSFSALPDLMGSDQFGIYSNEIAARNNEQLPFTQEQINSYAAGNDPLRFPSTDWGKETFASFAPESRTSLSISGGNDAVKYFVSGDHLNQVGMYKSGDLSFRQSQIRSNLDIKLFKGFNLGVDVTGRFGNNQEPGVDASYIYKHIYTNSPTEVATYPNGLFGFGGENGANPVVMSSNASGFLNRISNDLRGRISYSWDLGETVTEGLSIRGYAGIVRTNADTKSWYTPWTVHTLQEGTGEYIPQPGFSQRGNERILRESFGKFDELMLNSTLHYDKSFAGNHNISTFIGYEQFESSQRSFWAERRGFPTANHPELFAGSDEGQQSFGTSQEWGRINYFGSFSYDYNKKYFLDVTMRRDGSSVFAPGKRFGTFPGVAASWSIDKESFMSSVNWLNSLKLRASWAKMGNDRIAPFQFLTRYNYGGVTDTPRPNYYVIGGTSYNGYVSANVPNPDITWEVADMKNLGLNFTMFNNKLTGDINYFYQKRDRILITRNASIPDAAGLTLPQENLGQVDNFGWEFELGWNDKVGAVGYNLGMTFTNARNEVRYLDEPADVPAWRKREGFPMDSYIVYPTDGIFRDQGQVDGTQVKLGGTVEGEPIYLDTDGNGAINANDRIRVYSSNVPQIQFGVFGGINYKNVNVNFLLQGQAKAEMLVFFDQSGGAKPEYVFTERWTPDNRDARYPRAFGPGDSYSSSLSGNADNFEGADFWLHDASFLRLKEVEVGYTLPKDKIKFGDVKVFFRGFNLATMFSEVYKLGLDPEAVGYNNFRQATYPSLKSYNLGLNVSF